MVGKRYNEVMVHTLPSSAAAYLNFHYVHCSSKERLLSSSQRLTSGSVGILYSSRQVLWAGKALGKLENFPALLHLVTKS